MKISKLHAREILDSRGNPTVEAEIETATGVFARAAVPSGASTGEHEAHELRDGDAKRFNGKGVQKAVADVNGEIADMARTIDFKSQSELDEKLIALDGTETKSRLGANALLAVSLAASHAFAKDAKLPLYEYFHGLSKAPKPIVLPLPFCNVINGGKHAALSTDIQEFMLVPVGAPSFHEALRMLVETFHTLAKVLSAKGYATTVGDEGGFAPQVKNGNKEALSLLMEAIEKAGYTPGKDISLAIDPAASEFYNGTNYVLHAENDRVCSASDMLAFYEELLKEFPIVSIEDGLDENDWDGWKDMTKALGSKVQLIGDDILVTNVSFLKRAITEKAGNSILIKLNQIGTVTETIDAIDTAHTASWHAIVSHRSGETEDTSIAHLAVGLGTGQIKTGSVSRTERVAKYNELLRIEESLGTNAVFLGGKALA